jgi:hypothetical protein
MKPDISFVLKSGHFHLLTTFLHGGHTSGMEDMSGRSPFLYLNSE